MFRFSRKSPDLLDIAVRRGFQAYILDIFGNIAELEHLAAHRAGKVDGLDAGFGTGAGG